MKVKTPADAWAVADRIFPTDYTHDSAASARAGYPIFRGTLDPLDYICDLGDRLEVNLHNGKTVNIWIH